MTPAELNQAAVKQGLRLEARGDKLAVIPADRLTPDFARVLVEHKSELLAWLAKRPCPGHGTVPPADLPLNPDRPRLGTRGARRIMDYVVRQITGIGPLCEWCLKRENLYWDKLHWTPEECAYGAARDAGCWQTGRNEHDLSLMLEGLEEAAHGWPEGKGRP